MVFFNCNACGEALKKNQVDKHCQHCRCEVLSCVDCGKDFWGYEYKNHTKCMTEEEKYCGKANVPKVSKGEAKQEIWIERVQAAISKTPKDPQMSQLLENIKYYPNIPRKFGKFENFLKNSLCVHNAILINQVWDLLMTTNEINGTTNPVASVHDKHESQNADTRKRTHSCSQGMDAEKSLLTKTETEVCKRSLKQQKKVKSLDCQEIEAFSKSVVCDEEIIDHGTFLKQEDGPRKKRRKVKFNWEKAIMDVLKSKEDMSLKKLRKKVLTEFAAQHTSSSNKEDLYAKFEKKLIKLCGVKVSKDRVLTEFAAQHTSSSNKEDLYAKFEKKLIKLCGVKVSKDRVRLKIK